MATTSVTDIAEGKKPANPVAQFRDFLEKQKHQIAAALPKHVHPDRMIRLACTEFAKNQKLQECTPISVFGSIIQASQLGLEIGVLGQAYLVPFWNKKERRLDCQLIPGYKGLIALARRSGEVASIETHIVYSRDEFDMRLGIETSVTHKPNLDGDRGAPRLVYGVAKFKDGGYHFEWMGMAEVDRIRGRSQAGTSGPWVTDYEQMVRKTLIRRMANYLPMSIELANAIQIGDAADAGHKATLDGEFVVVEENQLSADPPAQIEQQQPGMTIPTDIRQPEKQETRQRRPSAQQAQQQEPPPYEPSAEEIAAIHAREMQEAGHTPDPDDGLFGGVE